MRLGIRTGWPASPHASGDGQRRDVLIAGGGFPERPVANTGQGSRGREPSRKRCRAEHGLEGRCQPGQPHSLGLENRFFTRPAAQKGFVSL